MIPEQALDLARRFEGLYLSAYQDPVGIWTIGYGHTRGAHAGQVIDNDIANTFLIEDMTDAVNGALRQCPVLALYPYRLAAVADFVFNLGESRLKISTMRKKINAKNWSEADREIRKWVFAGGRKLAGLVLRRAAEGQLILSRYNFLS